MQSTVNMPRPHRHSVPSTSADSANHTVMQLLFARGNFADLAGYLSRAYKGRFSALNGVEAMKAVAAGRDPVDDVAAMSQDSDAADDV